MEVGGGMGTRKKTKGKSSSATRSQSSTTQNALNFLARLRVIYLRCVITPRGEELAVRGEAYTAGDAGAKQIEFQRAPCQNPFTCHAAAYAPNSHPAPALSGD